MKNSLLLAFSVCALTLSLSGCEKNETDNLSRVKSYPAITLKGPEYVVLNVGEAFTDPGVTAVLAGNDIAPTVSGSVDTSKPGIYRISYTAANTEKDEVSAVRSVIVTDPAVNALDQSGNFQRGTFALSQVTKVGNKGLYKLDNFGFTNAPNLFTIYFAQTTPNSIVVPSQTIENLGYTNFASVSSVFTDGKLTRITYAIQAPAVFGTAARSANRVP